ncbi:MAG: CopG family transcriptional regulator [Limnohabitans sp.]|nr:CopG family transcriptional regulator [Limnohabitans sp.]
MTVSIRLDPLIEQRLDNLAHMTGRAKSYYLRELIESGLDDLEDFYLADATMERVRKGQEVVIDSSKVRGSLGLGH